jgi:hypothetical protein
MKKTVYSTFMILLLFACSLFLISCSAITAQNITYNNSAPGMNGNSGMNGNGRDNGNFMPETVNADLMGKIISVDGNSIKIELTEQTQINNSPNPNGTNGSQGNDNRQPQRGFPSGTFEINYTGIEKNLTVNEGVSISQQSGMARQNRNDNSKSAAKVSELEAGQIIMVWYKENTEAVERISIVQ